MKIAYLDMPSGISGDMFLGCLVDAGWPVEELRDTLTRLKLPTNSWSITNKNVLKGQAPLRAMLVDVKVAEPVAAAPLLPMHEHHHQQPHAPANPVAPAPAAPAGGLVLAGPVDAHVHRPLSDIRKLIESADLPAQVKERAIAVFTRLGTSEAKVHGTTLEKIHFHEVGALDAIVDIVGAVAGLHALGIEKLFASPLPLSHGYTTGAHGQIPLPAPATLEMIAAASAPTRPGPAPGEWVTPTGAALVCELAKFEQPAFTVQKIGIGAGQRECAWPNVARLWIGQLPAASSAIVQIETNIDDMNPQWYESVFKQLFAAGARDVWMTPIQMKKGRPAITLCVLADAANEASLSEIILRQTTTLGVRVSEVRRHEARREMRSLETQHGLITFKLKWIGEELIGATPEYDDCLKLAELKSLPVRVIVEAAHAAAQQSFFTARS